MSSSTSTDILNGGPRRAIGVGGWLAWLTIVVAVLGMFVSSPRLAAGDEDWHQATAWALISKGHVSKSWGENVPGPFPGSLIDATCFRGNIYQDASCIEEREEEKPAASSETYNYPPVYYLFVGMGQKAAEVLQAGFEDIGGRLGSMLLNLTVISLIGLRMRRRYPQWGTYLLLVVTPSVAYYWAVVNPNGWEITVALAFAYVLAELWWKREPGSPERTPGWRQLLVLGSVSVFFGLARPAAFVWIAALTIAVMTIAPSGLSQVGKIRTLVVSGSGVLVGVIWFLVFPVSLSAAGRTLLPGGPESPVTYLVWFQQSLAEAPERLRQVFGVLGWLELAIPGSLFLALLIAWTAFLTLLAVRGHVSWHVLVVGVVFGFITPSVIETVSWNEWPYWYQGRYTIPFLAGIVLLLLMRFGERVTIPATWLSILGTLALAYMIWLNAMRYSFGLLNYLPVRLTDPGMGWGPLILSLLCVVTLIGIAMLRAYRTMERTREVRNYGQVPPSPRM